MILSCSKFPRLSGALRKVPACLSVLCALWLASFSISASAQQMDQASDAVEVNELDPLPEALPVFRVGMLATRGAAYLQAQSEPFRKYLQEGLERPVEVVAFPNMKALIAAHTAKQVDYATYPASAFAMAQAACGCLIPVAAPVPSSGDIGTYVILVVNAEGPIKSLADMTGRSMALSSKSAAIPYHMGMNELRLAGLNPERDLSTVIVGDNPATALTQLQKGEVDAALVWSSTAFNQNLLTAPGAVSAFTQSLKAKQGKRYQEPNFLTIWQSRPIPTAPHVVHKDVSKQDRAELTTLLKDLNQDNPQAYDAIERTHAGGFRSIKLEDYAPLLDIATAKQ